MENIAQKVCLTGAGCALAALRGEAALGPAAASAAAAAAHAHAHAHSRPFGGNHRPREWRRRRGNTRRVRVHPENTRSD